MYHDIYFPTDFPPGMRVSVGMVVDRRFIEGGPWAVLVTSLQVFHDLADGIDVVVTHVANRRIRTVRVYFFARNELETAILAGYLAKIARRVSGKEIKRVACSSPEVVERKTRYPLYSI